MREKDIQNLKKPYDSNADPVVGRRVFEALGVKADSIRKLASQIYSDLDPKIFGIKWWAKYQELDKRKRILTSDYLFAANTSMEESLAEAKLHLIESVDSLEKKREVIKAHFVGWKPGTIFSTPKSSSAYDDVLDHLMEIHVVGFAKAIGTAFDCLAITIVGVLGLRTRMLKTDFPNVIKILRERKGFVVKAQGEFSDFLNKEIRACGPEDWTKWIFGFRNTVVHRPKRIRVYQLEVNPLFGNGGQPVLDHLRNPILKVDPSVLLPRDPGLSEVEALVKSNREPYLTEDVETTLNGIFDSSQTFISSVCFRLLAIWESRRRGDLDIEQPDQWPDDKEELSGEFKGYSPGSIRGFGEMNMGKVGVQVWNRMKCAALDGENFKTWSSL